MPHLVRWNNELSEFGLVVVGAHVQNASDEEVSAKSRELGINFAVVKGASAAGLEFKGIPHAVLFDHTGKCLYQGSPEGAEKLLRPAIGKALAESMSKAPSSKAVVPLVEALKRGQTPGGVLQKALPLQKSPEASTAEEATQLINALTAGASKRVEAAEALMAEDPLGAFDRLERVPAAWKGTAVAAKANNLLTTLRKDKTVAAELKARPMLESVRKLDGALSASARNAKIDPKAPVFQKVHAVTLRKMRTTLQQMKKTWPDARATAQALELGEKYGVTP
jgi:hypothetical protein